MYLLFAALRPARKVFAQTTRTGVTTIRNALDPSWLLKAAMYSSTVSLWPMVIVWGSFIVRKTVRPLRRDPAVSKCAPDSSTR